MLIHDKIVKISCIFGSGLVWNKILLFQNNKILLFQNIKWMQGGAAKGGLEQKIAWLAWHLGFDMFDVSSPRCTVTPRST